MKLKKKNEFNEINEYFMKIDELLLSLSRIENLEIILLQNSHKIKDGFHLIISDFSKRLRWFKKQMKKDLKKLKIKKFPKSILR